LPVVYTLCYPGVRGPDTASSVHLCGLVVSVLHHQGGLGAGAGRPAATPSTVPMTPCGTILVLAPPSSSRLSLPAVQADVRENVCNNRKKTLSHVFWILKKKREKRTFSFRGHLITPVFNTQLPKLSTGKSPTSNILLCNTVGEQP